MRLILALVFMAIGMWLYFQLGGGDLHPFIGIAVWFVLMFSSVIVCNEGFLRRIKGQTDEGYIKELCSKNLAVTESYQVSEAITFEDLSTGCLCHLLKVGDRYVLCLYGQYLYEYSEINDDPELNQDRKFPTSEFSLTRKIKTNEIMQLQIGSIVIDESRLGCVKPDRLHNLGIKLEDGEVIKGLSFSQIIEACA